MENTKVHVRGSKCALGNHGRNHCGYKWEKLVSLNGSFSYENLAFFLIWDCANAWAGKGKAVSGSQLISQSNNIYRILHVRGSMQTQWEIQRRALVHEKPGLVSLGGKVVHVLAER